MSDKKRNLATDSTDATSIISVNGHFYRVSRYCTHRGGELKYGYTNDKTLTVSCPLHRATFCLETGRLIGGPECGGIKTEKILEGEMFADLQMDFAGLWNRQISIVQ